MGKKRQGLVSQKLKTNRLPGPKSCNSSSSSSSNQSYRTLHAERQWLEIDGGDSSHTGGFSDVMLLIQNLEGVHILETFIP